MGDGFAFGLTVEYAERPPAATIAAAIQSLIAHFSKWAVGQSDTPALRLEVVKSGHTAPFCSFPGYESFCFAVAGVDDVGLLPAFVHFVCGKWLPELVAVALAVPGTVVEIGSADRHTRIDHTRARRWRL